MTKEITQVNVFSQFPFQGDRVALCPLKTPLEPHQLQMIADELNSPLTAFLFPHSNDSCRQIRCFTPLAPTPFYVQGALAATYFLSTKKVTFWADADVIEVDTNGNWLEIELGAQQVEAAPAPPALHVGLGVVPIYVGRNAGDYLVALSSEDVLRAIQPDFALLRELEASKVVLTARAETAGYDYVCRAFAPRYSQTEECVTAEAHALLVPFWAQRLHKKSLVALHASKRGGSVHVQVLKDKIKLATHAVVTMQMRLCDRLED